MPDNVTCSISVTGYDQKAVVWMGMDGICRKHADMLIVQPDNSVRGPFSTYQGTDSGRIVSVTTVEIFTIFVLNGADNRTYTFEKVKSNEKIKDLRTRIFRKLREPESQMRLDFHGKPLYDNETVAEAGIVNESTLQIIPGRLRGGIVNCNI